MNTQEITVENVVKWILEDDTIVPLLELLHKEATKKWHKLSDAQFDSCKGFDHIKFSENQWWIAVAALGEHPLKQLQYVLARRGKTEEEVDALDNEDKKRRAEYELKAAQREVERLSK